MSTRINFSEIEAALRHTRQSAQKGNALLFDSNAGYLRTMVEQFIEQERLALEHNSVPA